MDNNKIYLEGIISIEATIASGKRTVYEVFCDKSKVEKRDRKATYFTSFLKRNNINYKLCDREFIDSLAEGTSHGGFIASVSERKYSNFDSILSSLGKGEYLVFLDGVEDPFNFGYSIRNLFAFGKCRGFIIPERNWMTSANIVAKASAGASERCNIAVAPSDDSLTANKLIESGIDIVCSALSSTSIPLYSFKPLAPFILFIGGEKRGISKVFMEKASKIVHIPYSNPEAKYSLPTASCAAIFGSYLENI